MPNAKLVVVGSTNLDTTVRVHHQPRSGETVTGRVVARGVGGKGANQALAAQRAGAQTTFVTALGNQREYLTEYLTQFGIRVKDIGAPDAPSGSATVMLTEDGQNSILVLPEANATITTWSLHRALDGLVRPNLVTLFQCELPIEVVAGGMRATDELGGRIILNLAPYCDLSPVDLAICDPLVLNETEARQLTRSDVGNVEQAMDLAGQLLEAARSVVITLGRDGAVVAWHDGGPQVRHAAPVPVEVVDTTGAGDAFVGALSAALASGATLWEAVLTGNQAGAEAVQFIGAQPPPSEAHRPVKSGK